MNNNNKNDSLTTTTTTTTTTTGGGGGGGGKGCCSSPGCTNVVSQPLACPKCIQLQLPPTYFCGQQCYKENYHIHKLVHKQQQQQQIQTQVQSNATSSSSSSLLPSTSSSTTSVPIIHRKTPPSDGISCSPDCDESMKLSLPNWASSYSFTGRLRPALQSPQITIQELPSKLRKPDYASHPSGVSISEQKQQRGMGGSSSTSIHVYSTRELDGIDCDGYGLRHACKMGREVLDTASKILKVGVTTDEIDRVVYDACMERNVYPSPLNYYNFPKCVCTSINEVICHGIPDYRPVEDGDICNIDISVYNQGGYHSDLNETFCVGTKVPEPVQKLVETSFLCLQGAMELVKPGTLYRDLGNTIEKIAKQHQCSVVRTYCGHGVGHLFHTIPNIPHYAKNKAKGTMQPGHVFTIEPMINLGKNSAYYDKTWDDNWTAVTANGNCSSQFEHTILVTATGYEILTQREMEPKMIWNLQNYQR